MFRRCLKTLVARPEDSPGRKECGRQEVGIAIAYASPKQQLSINKFDNFIIGGNNSAR